MKEQGLINHLFPGMPDIPWDAGTENTEMTNNEEKRKDVLSSVLETLDKVTTPAKEAGDECGGIKLYLLGAYTVLHMLGIATDAEFNTLCEARKL